MNNYSMRDEQEKCFALQKGHLEHDHLRTWSEGGKSGRMFIYFVGLILASYVRSVWQKDDVLRKKFSSTEDVLQSTSPRLSQQPAKEVARLSQKWKNKSYRYTKLRTQIKHRPTVTFVAYEDVVSHDVYVEYCIL